MLIQVVPNFVQNVKKEDTKKAKDKQLALPVLQVGLIFSMTLTTLLLTRTNVSFFYLTIFFNFKLSYRPSLDLGQESTFEGSTECFDCRAGTFAALPGTESCKLCPEGFATGTSLSTSCEKCPFGKTSQNGTSKCVPGVGDVTLDPPILISMIPTSTDNNTLLLTVDVSKIPTEHKTIGI